MTKPIRVPGPDHPISIAAHPLRVLVTAGGRVIADTSEALALQESTYPPVLYIPRKDVDMTRLVRSDHSSHCPYKGEASYYSVAGDRGQNAVWTYESPYESVAAIKDYLAFYPDRVDSIEQRAG